MRPALLGLLGAALLAGLAARLVPDPAWAWAAACLFTMAMPGGLLAVLTVPPDEVSPPEWIVLALGLGLVALVTSALILTYLPVQLTPPIVLGWFGGLAVVLAGLATRLRPRWHPPALARSGSGALLDCAIVVGLGAALRLPSLGYSEFQGDETEVILRAAGVVQDLPDAIFYHAKGPAEVLVATVQYGLVGTLSEASARLPFALASLVGLATIYLAALPLLGRPGALATALLLAFNGYLVAFARIAQYQGLVFFMSALAVWCAVRWMMGGTFAASRWPILAGAFAAVGALAHYDAIFALPPIALLALRPGGLRGIVERRTLGAWLAGGTVGLALLLLFFGPYLLNPLYQLATDRVADRIGIGGRNNLPSIAASAALYVSLVYLALIGALVMVGGILLAVGRSARVPRKPPTWVWVLGLVWFAVPFLFYAFVARKPGTHIHVASTGLALLGGWAVAAAWGRRPARVWRPGTIALLGAALAVVGAYLAPIYLQTNPELVRGNLLSTFPLYRLVGEQVPRKERFGFPYEAGWKAVAVLYADGWLAGSYDSNENPQITHWYTRGAWRCTANPRYYLIAEAVQDEIEPPRRRIAAEYPATHVVTVAGQPKLRVHEYGARAGRDPTVWAAEALAERFDRDLTRTALDPGVWARGPIAPEYVRSPARFGDEIELLGYRILTEDPRPGGTIRVDLYWSPRVSTDSAYPINLQLGADRRFADGNGPGCDKSQAAQEWTAGRPFVQRASLSIADDAPFGRHPLMVGVASQAARGAPLPIATSLPARNEMVEIGQVDVGN